MFPLSSCILDIYFSNIFCLKIYSSDASQVVHFGHFELKIHFLKSVSWNETESGGRWRWLGFASEICLRDEILYGGMILSGHSAV